MKRLSLFGALILIGVIWGGTIPLSKIAVSTGYQPMGLIFWQLVISAAVLSAVARFRGTWPTIDRRRAAFFLTIGMLGTIIPNAFSYLSIAQLPAGVMSIIIASVPMFALTIALFARLERYRTQRMIGVAFGAGAIVLLIGPDSSLPDPEKAVYVLVALIAPFCYGLEANYLAVRTPPGTDPVGALLGASVIAAVIAFPLATVSGQWIDPLVPWGPPEWALVASSVLHAVVYAAYIWLVGAAGAVFASQVAYVVTASGFLISAWGLGETHSVWVVAALAAMIGGLALVQPRKRVSDDCRGNTAGRSESGFR